MPRTASDLLPTVTLHIWCHINKWKEKLSLEHGSFSLAPVSIVSKQQICFALILLKGFSQYLTFFFNRVPSALATLLLDIWQCLIFTRSFCDSACLVSLYLFSCSSRFQTKQHNFLSCPVQKLLHQLFYSQQRLWIFLLSSVSYVKHATLSKVTLLCQFIYRTFIFHSLTTFLSRSWKLVWIIL